MTPVWQLSFTGLVLGGIAASGLHLPGLASGLVYAAIPLAGTIWAISLWQLMHRIPPAPLRPLLALHLGPACLLATVLALQHHGWLAIGFASLGAGILLALIVSASWITQSGFTPFWGAFDLSARRLRERASDHRRFLARGGRLRAGRRHCGCVAGLGPDPAGLARRRPGRPDERGDRLDLGDPGPGKGEAGRIGLGSAAVGQVRMDGAPARMQCARSGRERCASSRRRPHGSPRNGTACHRWRGRSGRPAARRCRRSQGARPLRAG